MKKWHLPYIVGMVVALALLLGLVVIPYTLTFDKTYSGKEVFRTEADYSRFKEAIGEENVCIVEVITLSSNPPIVARFEVKVPYNGSFDYGESKDDKILLAILFSALTILVVGVLGIGVPVNLTWGF